MSLVARIFLWKQLEGTDGFVGAILRTVRVHEQREKGYGTLFYSLKHLTLVKERTHLLIQINLGRPVHNIRKHVRSVQN